jgi:6-pyruvoyltetrahydropterin/6-carboxytetrahydropterin synthase
MLQLTKIFHFEMGHAIYGYTGICKNIHGHSYELHVTVSAEEEKQDYIASPGFIIDFKEIKKLLPPKSLNYLTINWYYPGTF